MSLDIDIVDETECWSALPQRGDIVSSAILAVASICNADIGEGFSVTVLLCDDAEIRVLNRDFRHIDKATNVLSFPALKSPDSFPQSMLGDIAIAFETVDREAREEVKDIAAHTAHMVVHGMLHLLGYDHETPREAEAMEQLEIRILKELGIADPYADMILTETSTKTK